MSIVRCLTIILVLVNTATAAPHPGFGSSMLNSTFHSVILNGIGLKATTFPAGWTYAETPQCNNCRQIDLTYNSSGRMSFKNEAVNKDVKNELIVKKYIKDYNQYGFEVGEIKNYSTKDSTTEILYVDLAQKNRKTRARQFFIKNQAQFYIVTCTDEFDLFEKTVNDCGLVISQLKVL